jgi:putative transposase
LLTEANGVPLAIVVAGANRNDFKLARETIESIVIARPKVTGAAPQGLCLDKGYDYSEVRDLADEFRFTAHIRCRGEEARVIKKKARFKARRWVVERSHSWMNRFVSVRRTPLSRARGDAGMVSAEDRWGADRQARRRRSGEDGSSRGMRAA